MFMIAEASERGAAMYFVPVMALAGAYYLMVLAKRKAQETAARANAIEAEQFRLMALLRESEGR